MIRHPDSSGGAGQGGFGESAAGRVPAENGRRPLARPLGALAGLCGLTALASGCTQPQDTACSAFAPIVLDEADAGVISDDLSAEIAVHNLTGHALCGWFPDLELPSPGTVG